MKYEAAYSNDDYNDDYKCSDSEFEWVEKAKRDAKREAKRERKIKSKKRNKRNFDN